MILKEKQQQKKKQQTNKLTKNIHKTISVFPFISYFLVIFIFFK